MSIVSGRKPVPSDREPGLAAQAPDPSSRLEQFGYQQQLHRTLTTRDLVVYGMIFMVPIAPYSVFGFVWNDSRGMVPLAYLVGLIGMFFTALSYAAMSRAFPLAGSVYTLSLIHI